MMPGGYPGQAGSPPPEQLHGQGYAGDQRQQSYDSSGHRTPSPQHLPQQPVEYFQHDPNGIPAQHNQNPYGHGQPVDGTPDQGPVDPFAQHWDRYYPSQGQPNTGEIPPHAYHPRAGQPDVHASHQTTEQQYVPQQDGYYAQAGQAGQVGQGGQGTGYAPEHDPAFWSYQAESQGQMPPDGAHELSLSGQDARPPSRLRSNSPQLARRSHGQSKHAHRPTPSDSEDDNEPYDPPHRRPRQKRSNRQTSDQQQIQVVLPDSSRGKDDPMRSMSEQMQMMMMNQMMSQQMAAQQMQFAQMNAMIRDTTKGSGSGSESGTKKKQSKKKKRPSVNIKSKQLRGRPKQAIPIVAVGAPAQLPVADNTIESAAMENWQEATIILCLAIVGVIYLVVSRSNKAEEKEVSASAKHLVPKG